jgi:hypothetical protein
MGHRALRTAALPILSLSPPLIHRCQSATPLPRRSALRQATDIGAVEHCGFVADPSRGRRLRSRCRAGRGRRPATMNPPQRPPPPRHTSPMARTPDRYQRRSPLARHVRTSATISNDAAVILPLLKPASRNMLTRHETTDVDQAASAGHHGMMAATFTCDVGDTWIVGLPLRA